MKAAILGMIKYSGGLGGFIEACPTFASHCHFEREAEKSLRIVISSAKREKSYLLQKTFLTRYAPSK